MDDEPACVFYDYLSEGVQVNYVLDTMTAQAIFLYSGEGEHSQYDRFSGRFEKGLTWTSTTKAVVDAYGPPLFDYKSDDGGYESRRIAYSNISFRYEKGSMAEVGIGPEE